MICVLWSDKAKVTLCHTHEHTNNILLQYFSCTHPIVLELSFHPQEHLYNYPFHLLQAVYHLEHLLVYFWCR